MGALRSPGEKPCICPHGRCRRGSGLQTRAGTPPRSPAQLRVHRCVAPLGTGLRHPAPTSRRAGWRRLGRLGPGGGNLGKSEPRPPSSRPRPHLAMTPPTAPWPLPFLPDPSPRSPACLPRERSPLLLSAAPPRWPLPGGRSENPERRSAAPPGPGGLTGHAQ